MTDAVGAHGTDEESSSDQSSTAEEAKPFAAVAGTRDRSGGLSEEFAKALRSALHAKGFSELTEIQQAVLEPELVGRDLRISSQTGSGKTVAVGFVVAAAFESEEGDSQSTPKGRGSARTAVPRVLVVVPTRELAAQLGEELSWLYGRHPVAIAVVTGGTSVQRELRALGERPGMVIGTPGRLVDHLDRGSLDISNVAAVVLDEADEMLDMGFKDELDNIMRRTPEGRQTHMVSATFPPKVKALAKRYQKDSVLVEGTVGTQHEDIAHSAVIVMPHQRTDALVNLLLLNPEERFLVFVRTRVAASGVAGELASLGLSAAPLSGEMAQRERTRCLDDFRARKLQCVVATDVAARGLDIRGVQKVVHYDLPERREAFTHRSGRTGRAGEKGESIMLVPPRGRHRIEDLFRILQLDAKWMTPPTPAQIRKANRRRLLRKYGAVDPTEGAEAAASDAPEEMKKIAAQLLERRPAEAIIADLLQEVVVKGSTEPREIQASYQDSGPGPGVKRGRGPQKGPGKGRKSDGATSFVAFELSWGASTGADPKRVLAHVCRRAGINGRQVGAIRIDESITTVGISTEVANEFEQAVVRPDPRNPDVRIRRASGKRSQ